MPNIIEVRNLSKKFFLGQREIPVINDLDLAIERGEFVILKGPSGSGKTTLINLLGGIDRVTAGSITYNLNDNHNPYTSKSSKKDLKTDITKYSDGKLSVFRREHLSYVFQFYSLIPTLTALENVQLMAELVGFKGENLRIQAEHWLRMVGLEERMDSFPGQLSGGENQRVAIARAIAKEPQVLFCDEPTGQLDQTNGKQVVETLYRVCRSTKTTIIMVTHDAVYKNYGDRIFYLKDGRIEHLELNLTNK